MEQTRQELTVREAAAELDVTSQWIRCLLWDGLLRDAKKVDGQWKIPYRAVLERKMEQRTR